MLKLPIRMSWPITSGSKIHVKPGMTREDLIGINAGIVKSVAESILAHCPRNFNYRFQPNGYDGLSL